jgi:hypothetical protein
VLLVVPGKHGLEVVLLAGYLYVVIIFGPVSGLLYFPEISLEFLRSWIWYLLENILAQKITAVLHEPAVRMYFQINTHSISPEKKHGVSGELKYLVCIGRIVQESFTVLAILRVGCVVVGFHSRSLFFVGGV